VDEKAFSKAVSALPAFTPVLRRICKTVEDSNSSASEIEAVLRLDPVIAGKVLRLANSAYIGMPRNVSSLRNAVVLLGVKRVHSLVLASHILGPGARELTLPFSIIRFWRHSVTTALIAEAIARYLKRYENFDEHEVFAGALLHDIGKLIQGVLYPALIVAVEKKSREELIPFFIAEQEHKNHELLGAMYCEHWCLPFDLTACISGHHNPKKQTHEKKQVSIIHVADIMSHILGYSVFPDEIIPGIDEQTLSFVEVPLERLRVIAETAVKDQRAIESLVEII
jgi:putative nucleotidyltransferase with HDIG domain